MPDRIIRQGILTSDDIDKLTPEQEVFYRRLLNVVDDYGLFDGRPSVILAACYPLKLGKMSLEAIASNLRALARNNLIELYSVEGRHFLQVHRTRWLRRSKPKFPMPSARNCAQSADNCTVVVDVVDDVDVDSSEPGVPATEQADARFPNFPCVGNGSKFWAIDKEMSAELSLAYPGVQVDAEARKAHAWIITNPQRRKTAKGMPRFLNSWLSRAQNNSKGKQPSIIDDPASDDWKPLRGEAVIAMMGDSYNPTELGEGWTDTDGMFHQGKRP
jgi:hypothetical protein